MITETWAIMSAMTSAWAHELVSLSTPLVPTPTSFPLCVSKTAAPKGPPVPRTTFSRASAIATRILASSSGYVRWRSTTFSTQSGFVMRISEFCIAPGVTGTLN